MSVEARARLTALIGANFANGGHRALLPLAFNDVADVGNETASAALSVIEVNVAVQQALALALAIIGGAQGIGVDPLDVPRVLDHGTAAFWSADALRGRWPVAIGAGYQILPQDFGKHLIAETGTLTTTLPLLSDLGAGWWIGGYNRSGNNHVIQRGGAADVIGASATSITVATGTAWLIAYRDSVRFERLL